MDTTISVLTNKLRDASDWVTWISEAPFARAVVFGVNIGGHLFVEGLLLVVILFLLSQKSYKPPKRPLTKKEIDELCEEWVPEPLIPTITDEMKSEPPVLESAAGPHTTVNGKEVINFTSANYLGLLGNEKLLEACTRALEKYGVGSCGPRGFYGTIDVHLDCEARIAKFLGTPDSILYSYGLSTMFSAIPAFCKKGDVIVADEGVHWGIQNGLQLSRSTIIYFKHNDMESLRNTLEKITQENKLAKKLRRYIIVEAVYQNSGRIAPLDEIIKLKEKYRFRVLLDESNSLGVLGSSGKGLTEYYNVPVDKIDIITAAMGHALATEGGFCTGSTRVIEHQRLSSSGYVFSASLPPYLASAAVKAFDILEENPDLITKLRENINILFKGLQDIQGMEIMSDPLSPIVFLRLKKSTGSSKSDLKLLEDIANLVLKEDSVFVVTSPPIEEVRLTVPNTDDPTLPVWTFRMWILGVFSCVLLSFLNQFFSYRKEPLIITQITVQVATLPIGRFMAAVLPTTKFRILGFGSREFSLNPGPFNMKEHVLITIFANAGFAFGNGSAYAVGIVNIIKAFYHRNISFVASWLLIITTQVLGYGWAGLLRKYVVEPAHMWWPSTLVQISLFRALHEKEDDDDNEIVNANGNKRPMSRAKFFVIALVCSFSWYIFPGYLFQTLSSISWVCWAYPKSVTAQQIGSGLNGLGIGAFTLDWATVASFLFSPLIYPFFAIANVFVGYALILYVVIPISYWGFNVYNAKKFPLYSSDLFTAQGQVYNISLIVNNQFKLDEAEYDKQGRINLSLFFTLTYGFGFATIASTLSHVGLFYGREIYQRFRASSVGKVDVHTRLMRRYKDIPSWWFYLLLLMTTLVSLALCIFLKSQVQLPFWGLLLAAGLAFIFTLPISIITATTNQTPGLNIITEYIMGTIYPGRPIANVCFKTYGYMSMTQAISFLSDFKLGHYMKIPPRSMFLVQFVGTIIAGTVNLTVAWWLLGSIDNICHQDKFSNSPWTCPGDHVFFDASVIWGLVSPKRIFGHLGNYSALNWFFLGGLLGPVLVWLLHKSFPKQTWIPLINLPVLLGATAFMPPATALNYNSWILVGTIFNFFVFRYRKKWWQRYNYILSAALDAGVAFMAVLLYFTVGMEDRSINWWGNSDPEHCDLATCPTAKGITINGCPTF